MAAPEYVPLPKIDTTRVYESPPWRPEPWVADRPAELAAAQPSGPGFGYQGPDQGFAFRLARGFADDLVLTEGEKVDDVISGCVGIATRRASLFGRAPTVHDLAIAFTVWGFLADAPAELVALRKPAFDEIRHPHHYAERRQVVDAVPEAVLRMTPAQVAEAVRADWRSVLVLR